MITSKLVTTTHNNYVRCAPDSSPISSDQDVLDLLAYCTDPSGSRLLLESRFLHPDFFDLSTKLAGAILLKLSAYRVKTAIVADLSVIPSQRFQEMVRESNRGSQINYFESVKDAEEWLIK
ncbi:MAG: DUF4180 domain-containing protein [Chloroflexi bacterium]|nr:DUF4180 domain-containing protein [Chloroflexota bacterium]